MGGKDKVPVKAGGQFSTLQAGAEQKTVGPARRDRRGAQALLSPGSVSDSQLSSCAS
jgi:hypothetical protein